MDDIVKKLRAASSGREGIKEHRLLMAGAVSRIESLEKEVKQLQDALGRAVRRSNRLKAALEDAYVVHEAGGRR